MRVQEQSNDNRLTDKDKLQAVFSNDNRLTDSREKQSASLGTQDLQSNSNDNRLTDNVGERKKQPVSLEKSDKTEANNDNRLTDNVSDMETKGKNKVKIAYCEYSLCGKEFIQTVSWKRFCCDDCRVANWELKHGKTFKKGKSKTN